MHIIDLRSDTVTRPSEEMRRAMAAAEVGDDVYGEDPTVNQLEEIAAQTTGKEAAIFVTSGTQSNLLALLSHCQRGDEYIVGQQAHTYCLEGGGGAIIGSIQPQPLDFEVDGTLDLKRVAAAVKPDDIHFAKTRLLCLENTHNGKVLPPAYLQAASDLAAEHGLCTHLDGARVFNAAVKMGVEVAEITRHFDTVSFCLSKGLGAPVGSVLCGSREVIKQARRWRKVVGGGMRQAGILAAAGRYALANNVTRLAQDHEHAQMLAYALARQPALKVDTAALQTNMVFVSTAASQAAALQAALKAKGILISGRDQFRLVTHLDISRRDIERVIECIDTFFNR